MPLLSNWSHYLILSFSFPASITALAKVCQFSASTISTTLKDADPCQKKNIVADIVSWKEQLKKLLMVTSQLSKSFPHLQRPPSPPPKLAFHCLHSTF